jgi:hypothetical protein
MNLQERVTALMFAENYRVLSRVRSRLLALWEGDTVELSTMMEVLERAGFPREEVQLHLVEVKLKVVGRRPSLDICPKLKQSICSNLKA